MTQGQPTPQCLGCAKPSFREGMYCVACLEETMKNMTPEDWTRALGDVCDSVLDRPPGETGKTE